MDDWLSGDAGSPHFQIARDHLAVFEMQAIGSHARDDVVQFGRHSERVSPGGRVGRRPQVSSGQYAVSHVDDGDVDSVGGAETTIALHGTRGEAELCRELHAGRTGADDADRQALSLPFRDLHRGVQKGTIEGARLCAAVEHVAMLRYTLDSEVVYLTAEREDQFVIIQRAWAENHLATRPVLDGRQTDRTCRGIETDQSTVVKAKSMRLSEGEVADLVFPGIHQTCSDLVQARLPKMTGFLVDQHDFICSCVGVTG